MPPEDTSSLAPDSGAQLHYRALERLYHSAPVNRLFSSELTIVERGVARLAFDVDERSYETGHIHALAHRAVRFARLFFRNTRRRVKRLGRSASRSLRSFWLHPHG